MGGNAARRHGMNMEHTQADVIDELLCLKPHDPLFSLRHARKKVVDATQAFHELAFFSNELSIEQRQLRLFAATLTARQTGPEVLVDYYKKQLVDTTPPGHYLTLLDQDHPEGPDRALHALAQYTRTLAL